jgi:CubicO group peptidase (beta-lactamase class C family)
MKRIKILVLLCFFQSILSQTPNDEKLNKIRTDLQTKIEKKELASVAIGVIKNGRTVWKENLGWADRERHLKADSKTIYPLGSLSKSITATALWLLVEKGKLKIDDTVEKHLKSTKLNYFQGTPNDLKINHLLNMEGGIPHQFEYFYDQDKEQIPTLHEQIRRYGLVAFPPGKTHHYSNFSFGILEQIIADVSGHSFAGFMTEEVFKPLGMTGTFVQRPEKLIIANGYDSKGNPLLPGIFTPRGGAGMYSTLDDLLNYGLGHLNQKKLLQKETLEKIQRPQSEAPNPYYSSGWGVLPVSAGRVSLLANGAIAGAATTILIIPKESLIIVCLTNTTAGNDFSDGTAFNIAGALLDGYTESLGRFIEKVEPLFAGKAFVADDSYLGEWKGSIKTEQGDLQIKLNFKANSQISVFFNGHDEEIIMKPTLEKGLLKGKFKGAIPTTEAMKKPHQISLELMKEGDKMFGIATAQSNDSKPKFFLPFYIELVKN